MGVEVHEACTRLTQQEVLQRARKSMFPRITPSCVKMRETLVSTAARGPASVLHKSDFPHALDDTR